jgi:hypothetical protein
MPASTTTVPSRPGRGTHRDMLDLDASSTRPLADCARVGLERGPASGRRPDPTNATYEPQHTRRIHGPWRAPDQWRGQPCRYRSGHRLNRAIDLDQVAVMAGGSRARRDCSGCGCGVDVAELTLSQQRFERTTVGCDAWQDDETQGLTIGAVPSERTTRTACGRGLTSVRKRLPTCW